MPTFHESNSREGKEGGLCFQISYLHPHSAARNLTLLEANKFIQ